MPGLGGLLVLVGVACRPAPVDPERQRIATSLRAWQQGERALAEGRAPEAVEHLQAAHQARPSDPLLGLWLASALAESGRLEEALDLAESAVARSPNDAWAWAAIGLWRLRAGQTVAAREDLWRAVRLEPAQAPALRAREELKPLLADPAFAFLLPGPLQVELRGPEASVFLGSRVDLALTVRGSPPETRLSVTGQVLGPVRLVAVTEAAVTGPEGRGSLLTYTVQVTGAGTVDAGPVEVRAGLQSGVSGSLRFEALAPPDHPDPPVQPSSWPVPSSYLALSEPTWTQEGWIVPVASEEQVKVLPEQPVVTLRLERPLEAPWKGLWLPAPPPATRLMRSRPGGTTEEKLTPPRPESPGPG